MLYLFPCSAAPLYVLVLQMCPIYMQVLELSTRESYQSHCLDHQKLFVWTSAIGSWLVGGQILWSGVDEPHHLCTMAEGPRTNISRGGRCITMHEASSVRRCPLGNLSFGVSLEAGQSSGHRHLAVLLAPSSSAVIRVSQNALKSRPFFCWSSV
jgi:hypothetical protein